MNCETKREQARAFVTASLAFALIIAMGTLSSIPAVYAVTQCTPNGGNGLSDKYRATWENTGGDVYGNYGIINADTWSLSGSALSTWTSLIFDDQAINPNWLQAGLIAGTYNSTRSTTSRVMYLEAHFWGDTAPRMTWLTSDAIPQDDNNHAEVWTQAANVDGTYTVYLYIDSASWSVSWSGGYNSGTHDYQGTPTLGSENTYTSSANCNNEVNDQSSASVSTTIAITPTWSSWGNSNKMQYQDSPYLIYQYLPTHYYEYCNTCA